MKRDALPVKVRFTYKHNIKYRGTINRHNRRRYLKLSQLGKLFLTDMPWWWEMQEGA